MVEITNKNLRANNFWFGFSLGVIGVSVLVYFFGTKKGRKTLKNLLEITENLEENLSQLIKEIEKEGSNTQPPKPIVSTINTLIERVKNFSS